MTNTINGVILRTGDDQSGDDENVVPSYGLMCSIIDGFGLDTVVKSVKISGSSTELRSGETATIPLASTSAAGAVQLSTATNGTSNAKAATESAVKAVRDYAGTAVSGIRNFSAVTAGGTSVAPASNAATLTLAAGSNVTITGNNSTKTITISATDTVYQHPSYTARTGNPSDNQTPSFGGSFTVSQIFSDTTGHVTNLADRTITIPSLPTASTGASGIVQLSSSTNSTSATVAATPAAVKLVRDYAGSVAAAGVTKSAVAAALQAQGISSADNLDDMDALAAQIAKIVAVLEALD